MNGRFPEKHPPASLAFLLLVPLVALDAGEVKIAGVFADHMVVQRGKPVPIWGRGTPGDEVTVQFAGQTKTVTVAPAGKWQVTLDPMPASAEPRTLLTTSKTPNPESRPPNPESRITDVLVGDVFLLAGQSNMSWWLSGSTGGEEAVTRADHPWLRHFDPGWQCTDEPAPDVSPNAKWQVCTPEVAGRFSGVGFFFAEALHAVHGVPIALVQTDIAATWGENWVSRAAMEADPEFRYCLDKYEAALAKLPEEQKRWATEKAVHEQEVAEAKAAGKTPPKPSYFVENGPMGPKHTRRPHALYNGRVAPLMPFAVRGIIWYQGEGNTAVKLAEKYHKLLTTLVQSWRAGFAQEDVPFFIVQLPRFDYDDPWHSWPLVREAQMRVGLEQPNCGFVSLIDEGEGKEIHPRNKRPVGERLARLARSVIYGEDLVPCGPVPERHEIKRGVALVTFRFVGKGLQARDGALRTFAVCGADQVFHPATAEITGADTIRISCPEVAEPVAVRYAWEPFPDCSLFNSDELPASPFRTDDFEVGHYLPLKPYLERRKKNKE